MRDIVSSGIFALVATPDDNGQARMVDVSDKAETARTAKATAVVRVGAEAYKLIQQNQMKKGDVLTVAQVTNSCKWCGSRYLICFYLQRRIC